MKLIATFLLTLFVSLSTYSQGLFTDGPHSNEPSIIPMGYFDLAVFDKQKAYRFGTETDKLDEKGENIIGTVIFVPNRHLLATPNGVHTNIVWFVQNYDNNTYRTITCEGDVYEMKMNQAHNRIISLLWIPLKGNSYLYKPVTEI